MLTTALNKRNSFYLSLLSPLLDTVFFLLIEEKIFLIPCLMFSDFLLRPCGYGSLQVIQEDNSALKTTQPHAHTKVRSQDDYVECITKLTPFVTTPCDIIKEHAPLINVISSGILSA